MDQSWLLDRSWIRAPRVSEQYETRVEYFIEYVIRNGNDDMNGKFFCPCVNCCNEIRLELDVIREHLLCDGFLKNYTRWIWHGKNIDIPNVSAETQTQNFTQEVDMDDRLEEMIRDVGLESFKRAHMYETLCRDSEKTLYPNCTKFTRLSAILRFTTRKKFPAYENLCGYSVKGHKACPICEEGTCYHQLHNWKKTIYLGHRRFLKPNHKYQRLKKAFNGYQEYDIAPIALTGEEVYERVKNLNVVFGKPKKQSKDTNIWKKKSILFV
uniref:Transposase-associated domain-containing protein n=1 Tax=Cajanus cajan TaxID=3821 RepID=A0A151T354_CAJCA|nr:hypothetical protein KK1_015976 [Cajanus cajan]